MNLLLLKVRKWEDWVNKKVTKCPPLTQCPFERRYNMVTWKFHSPLSWAGKYYTVCTVPYGILLKEVKIGKRKKQSSRDALNKEKTLSNEPASLILTLYASKLFCFHSSICSLFLSYFVFIHLFVLCFKAYFLILIKRLKSIKTFTRSDQALICLSLITLALLTLC